MECEGGGQIPAAYGDYMDVFSKRKAETLPPHRVTDHSIEFEPGIEGNKLPYGWICNLLEMELKALKEYIEINLSNGFIHRSTSQTAAPILFVRKKDGSLRLCVDF